MKDKFIISIVAIGGVVILESIALYKGINGSLLMGSLAIIGGIAGYELKVLKDKIVK